MTANAEDIGMLKDALNTLRIVFDEYAHEIYEKHDVLFDEYDLTDLELYIEKVEKEGELLNPNCSEMICRLPTASMDEAKKMLEGIGLELVDMPWYISFSDDVEKDYIVNPENPNSPDYMYHAYLHLVKDFEEKGIFVVGHQHCQHQLYSTIDKIEQALKVSFFGSDGGYDFDEEYKDWKNKKFEVPVLEPRYEAMNGQKVQKGETIPVKDYHKSMRKRIREFFEDKKFMEEVEALFKKSRILKDNEIILEWMKGFKKPPKNVTLTRKRYILLQDLVRKKLQPQKKEIVEEELEEINNSWMSMLPGEKEKEETMADERRDQLFNYSTSKIAETFYLLMYSRKLRNIFLDEKWEKWR